MRCLALSVALSVASSMPVAAQSVPGPVLHPAQPEAFDYYGWSLTASEGGTSFHLLLGAIGDGPPAPDGECSAGTAHLLRPASTGGTWEEEAELAPTPPFVYCDDHFGGSVALDYTAGLAAVGAPGYSVFDTGRAYVFKRNPAGVWAQEAFLRPPQPANDNEEFGTSMALLLLPSGDTLTLGGARRNAVIGTPEPGVVYLHAPDAGAAEWTFVDSLLAPDGHPFDGFGTSLAVVPLAGGHLGDALAFVGAPDHDLPSNPGSNRDGAAYAFRRDGATGRWAFEQKLPMPDPEPPGSVSLFGFSVALLTLPGGAPGEAVAVAGAKDASSTCGIANGGGAYAFYRSAEGVWALEARLCPLALNDLRFGASAALAPGAFEPLGGEPGAVRALVGSGPYLFDEHPGEAGLFERDPMTGQWTRRATFASGLGGSALDQYGWAVALAGPWAFVGAPLDDAVGESAGAVYVYGQESVSSEPGPPMTPVTLSVTPNPTRGAATVVLTLSAPGPVRVGLYDVLGREVAALFAGPLPAGRHALPLDTGALPSGVYLLRAEAGAGSVTRRLTVAR